MPLHAEEFDVKFEVFVDNVAIVAPDGKTKVLAAGALEIEEKFADIEKELKVMLEHEDHA